MAQQHHIILLAVVGCVLSLYFIISTYVSRQHQNDESRVKRHQVAHPPKPKIRVVGCTLKHIDPFSDEIMKHVPEFGELSCPSYGLDVSVTTMGTIFLANGDVATVQAREITRETTLGSFVDLHSVKSHTASEIPVIKRNQSGALMNALTKLCIVPTPYDHNQPPDEIGLIFANKCETQDAQFVYTQYGLIKHNLTKKCFAPRGDLQNPPENAVLVLSDHCKSSFNIIYDGVLQLVGSRCVHPQFGGDPTEGKKLCMFSTCTSQERLTYRWFVKRKRSGTKGNITFSLATEMSHVKINLLNEDVMDTYIDTYALSVIPKQLPTTKQMAQPNIVVICIEEASAQHFKRKLQHTDVVMSNMSFIRYNKHAAISPSSNVNIMNMIYGNSRKDGTKDDSIFTLAKTSKYISMFSADDPSSVAGVEKGLKDVDHNSLPFFQVFKKTHQLGGFSCYCMTGKPIYNITFNYLLSFLKAYPSHPKLAVILLAEVCRPHFDNLGYIGYLDKQFKKLLEYLNTLKNTVVLIQTLKGGTTKKLREVEQGRDEVKRPFLATYVSKDIRHTQKFEVTRSDQLSTVIDTYATLRHLISQKEEIHKDGKSLLKTLHPRNCSQAAITSQMCPCVGQGDNI